MSGINIDNIQPEKKRDEFYEHMEDPLKRFKKAYKSPVIGEDGIDPFESDPDLTHYNATTDDEPVTYSE